jgi:hypothetical protein
MKDKQGNIIENTKPIKQPLKIMLGETFEVEGNLYVITTATDSTKSTNLTNGRNIYELKLMP